MADWYASPSGSAGGDGSIGDPWDLATALTASGSVSGGDTIHLRGGTSFTDPAAVYTISAQISSTVAGASDVSRVTIKPYQSEIVILDATGLANGNYVIDVDGAYTDWWYIWIRARNANRWQSNYAAGLQTHSNATGTSLYFCVVHDMGGSGFSMWDPAGTGLMHGCVAFYNGYDDTDRGHGHGLYTQNSLSDTKTIELSAFGFNFGGYGLHAYTESGSVDGFTFQQCLSYVDAITGGLQPTDETTWDENYWMRDGGAIGATGEISGTVTLTDNVLPGGAITKSGTVTSLTETGTTDADELDAVYVHGSSVDNDRAIVAIYNRSYESTVTVDLSGLGLTHGRAYYLVHMANPLQEGVPFTYDSGTGTVDVPASASWSVGTPYGHDAADVGSQVPAPPFDLPDHKVGFYLVPQAQWPAISQPAVPEVIPMYRSAATAAVASSDTLTVAKPAGTAEGDLLVAVVVMNNSETVTSTGFTAEFTDDFKLTTSASKSVLYKVAGASEPSTYDFVVSTSGRHSMILLAVQNPNTSSPWDVAPSDAVSAGSNDTTHPTVASIAVSSAPALAIGVAGKDAASTTWSGVPAGYTEAAKVEGTGQPMIVAYREIATAGSVLGGDFDSSTTNVGEAMLFAVAGIDPNAGAPSTPSGIPGNHGINVAVRIGL